MKSKYPQSPALHIAILGATATGKTRLAVRLSKEINGEIISADSRQVYRGMDIGTGKDLSDYQVEGFSIPYHLIDILNPGEEYSVFEFKRDATETLRSLSRRNTPAILCGGTGLYLESVLKNYEMREASVNASLRQRLSNLSNGELENYLKSRRQLHNTTDIKNRDRLIRAVEIARQTGSSNPEKSNLIAPFKVYGIQLPREMVRNRITERLTKRLEEGLIEEIVNLMKDGIRPEQLYHYGLEYKWVTKFCLKEISYQEMFTGLNIAIHQFSKRQMTWFRRMDRRGTEIHWLDGTKSIEENMMIILNTLID